MRKVSTLIGLTLFLVLAPAARAEESTPAEDKPAPAEDKAITPPPAPAAAEAAPATGQVAAVPAPTEAAVGPRKLQLGLSFLSMAIGRYTYAPTGESQTEDASFAYGFGLTGSYEVLPGLLVGLAPQITFDVKPKTVSDGAKQVDLLARVAYAYRLPEGLSVYAEVLPGYSMILLKSGAAPKGWVLAFGAGCAMDLSERIFASLGVGYQLGFQHQKVGDTNPEHRTRFLRVALGGGVRF